MKHKRTFKVCGAEITISLSSKDLWIIETILADNMRIHLISFLQELAEWHQEIRHGKKRKGLEV